MACRPTGAWAASSTPLSWPEVVGSKRVAQPFQLRFGGAVDGDDVESTVALRQCGIGSQIGGRCAEQSALFALIDTARSTAKLCVGADADFDKDQRVTLIHDEVEFAKSEADVGSTKVQSSALKMVPRSRFALLATLLPGQQSTQHA